jgi:cytochrome c oxidase cbb3-type subunit 3
MTTAWSVWVVFLVVLNIGGCVWLLWWTAKRRPGDPAPTDTSHIWDGDLTEYNKPMPRWWINLFYLTIAFGIGYFIYYPGLGAYAGTSHWTSAKEHDADKAAEDRKLDRMLSGYAGKPIDVLARDPDALRIGRSVFSNTCAGCHGSGARGAIGYPNLTDTIWHWGGSPDRVLQTVLDGREGVMPAWGKTLTSMGGDNAVIEVAAYVRVLGTPDHSLVNNYLAVQGKPMFDGICAGCHGPEGKGNPQIGAPDLTDSYWLYGGSDEAIRQSIAEGRHGTMPAWHNILGETRARLVAAWVWSLSNPPPDKKR